MSQSTNEATSIRALDIIFAGTPDFAVQTLKALLESPHNVIAVYTQPDRPAGRGRKLSPSPVKTLANEAQIPVYQPNTLKEIADQTTLQALKADLMVVVAYGLILPKAVLQAPRFGCLNVHASLLPRWRGAAPIQRAIAAGDSASGVTIMQMDEGLDTGDMLSKATCKISFNETGGQLHDQLASIGAQALIDCVNQISLLAAKDSVLIGEQQDESQASYAQKLSKQEAQIDWTSSALSIHNLIRAFNPWPVATTHIDTQPCRIWTSILDPDQQPNIDQSISNSATTAPGTIIHASKLGIVVTTGDYPLSITQLQLQGGKVLSAEALLNSKKALFQPGKRFT